MIGTWQGIKSLEWSRVSGLGVLQVEVAPAILLLPQSFVSWAQSHCTDEKSRLRKGNNAFRRLQLRKWLGGGGKRREEKELEGRVVGPGSGGGK